jgi:hypothetical protein
VIRTEKSRAMAELGPWRERTLDQWYPYLMLDARYEKARVEHRMVDLPARDRAAEGVARRLDHERRPYLNMQHLNDRAVFEPAAA